MKLAIIGSYGHLGTVLAGLKDLPDVQLVAAAPWGDGDPMHFTDDPAWAQTPVHDDWREMLADVEVDVAAVFTPFAQLGPTAAAAAGSDCHVFMEKPLAITREDLEALRVAVYTAGVQLAACLNMRGAPAYQALRRAVLDGRIGEPICATAQKSYPFNQRDEFYASRETYGGTIPWVGIHALDYLSWCTGLGYRRLAAVASNLAHPSRPGMEDQCGILAELDSGAAATISLDYLRPWGKLKRPWGDDRLRVAGTDGVLETTECGHAVELMTADATEMLPLPPAVNVFTEFIAGLRGSREPLISTEESFRITEVALAARDAQDSGEFIDV